ncbi:MAG: transposase [Bacteroidota bacterium]
MGRAQTWKSFSFSGNGREQGFSWTFPDSPAQGLVGWRVSRTARDANQGKGYKRIVPKTLATDYRQNGKRKLMTLTGLEFLHRFCQHILPSGFVRIRHYGILANVHKEKALMAARRSLDVPDPPPKEERKVRVQRLIERLIDRGLDDCADCGAVGSLVRILIPPDARAPPKMSFNQAGI